MQKYIVISIHINFFYNTPSPIFAAIQRELISSKNCSYVWCYVVSITDNVVMQWYWKLKPMACRNSVFIVWYKKACHGFTWKKYVNKNDLIKHITKVHWHKLYMILNNLFTLGFREKKRNVNNITVIYFDNKLVSCVSIVILSTGNWKSTLRFLFITILGSGISHDKIMQTNETVSQTNLDNCIYKEFL